MAHKVLPDLGPAYLNLISYYLLSSSLWTSHNNFIVSLILILIIFNLSATFDVLHLP